MSGMLLVEAVNQALHRAMEHDESVLVIGQDVGASGGVFRATDGLHRRFGDDRVVDTPLAEAGIMGSAVGLCMTGMRPVCEMQFDSFSYPALDQVLSHVSRYRWRTAGAMGMPLVVRIPYGGGVRAPELHEDSPEAYYCHTPGLKVVVPSNPADALGLLTAAIRDPDPVIFLEPKKLYRATALRCDVPDGDHVVPIGEVATLREGDDATIVCWGAMVEVAMAAATSLEDDGIGCHVCDVRTLSPLDEEGLLAAVARTGRVVVVQEAPRRCSVASEIAALCAERAMYDLQAPVRRITGFDVPYPYWSIEDYQRPDAARVIAAVHDVLGG